MSEAKSGRRERQLGLVTPNLQRYEADRATDWLDAIKRQVCPFCGAGPFTVVAIHVNHAHNIDRRRLRDMLGLYYSDSICDPAYAAAAAAKGRRQFKAGRTGIGPMQRGTTKTLSRAAVKLQTDKAQMMSDDQRKEVGQVLSRKRRAEARERDVLILAALDAGGTDTAVGAQFGIWPSTVRSIARRNGRQQDGRTRYGASRRGQIPAGFAKAKVDQIAKAKARNAAMVARWRSGATYLELAAEFGGSSESVRARLKKLGEVVPDGRSSPDRKPAPPRKREPRLPCSVDGCDKPRLARDLCSMHYQRTRAAR